MKILSVGEYASLTTDAGIEDDFDHAVISEREMAGLEAVCARFPQLGSVRNRRTIRLNDMVGTLMLPGGRQLEILPKTASAANSPVQSRRLLCKILRTVLGVKPCITDPAPLELFRLPLTDWVAHQFLRILQKLVRPRLRSSYTRVEERRPFLRGKLNVQRQLNALPHELHLFHICHDIFSLNRPENRLLKSALSKIGKTVISPDNLRLCRNLATALTEIPDSSDVEGDFARWGTDRLATDYAVIRPWCELVLGNEMPYSVAGRHVGPSWLFHMPTLFEKYVEKKLSERILPEVGMKVQKKEMHLCTCRNKDLFGLQPDLRIIHRTSAEQIILDTKWKYLEHPGDIKQEDVTQVYVYGQYYLKGAGRVGLIYPCHACFPAFEEPLVYGDRATLHLHILGYNLETDCLEADPSFPLGDWFMQ